MRAWTRRRQKNYRRSSSFLRSDGPTQKPHSTGKNLMRQELLRITFGLSKVLLRSLLPIKTSYGKARRTARLTVNTVPCLGSRDVLYRAMESGGRPWHTGIYVISSMFWNGKGSYSGFPMRLTGGMRLVPGSARPMIRGLAVRHFSLKSSAATVKNID